jgi:hypothetical protein
MNERELTVTETTIYALSMPKYVYVQIAAYQNAQPVEPRKIRADTIEKIAGENTYVFKLNGQKIGEFAAAIVAGWWIQDED